MVKKEHAVSGQLIDIMEHHNMRTTQTLAASQQSVSLYMLVHLRNKNNNRRKVYLDTEALGSED